MIALRLSEQEAREALHAVEGLLYYVDAGTPEHGRAMASLRPMLDALRSWHPEQSGAGFALDLDARDVAEIRDAFDVIAQADAKRSARELAERLLETLREALHAQLYCTAEGL